VNRFSRLLLTTLTALAWMAPTAAAQTDQTVDLHPAWKTGQVSRYRITETSLTTIEADGLPKPQQMLTEFVAEVTWEVLDARPDGGGRARLAMGAMRMKLTGADGETHTITAHDADERFASMRSWIRALTENPLEITVSAQGEIEAVAGQDAVRRAAGELGEKLDDGYFREIGMDLAVLIGGGRSVAYGGTWRHQHSGKRHNQPPGDVQYDTTYELAGVENIAGIPLAMVKRRTRLSFTPELPELPDDAPPIEIDVRLVEQSNEAQLMFDLTRHELAGANDDTTLVFEIRRSLLGRQATMKVTEKDNTQVLRLAEE